MTTQEVDGDTNGTEIRRLAGTLGEGGVIREGQHNGDIVKSQIKENHNFYNKIRQTV